MTLANRSFYKVKGLGQHQALTQLEYTHGWARVYTCAEICHEPVEQSGEQPGAGLLGSSGDGRPGCSQASTELLTDLPGRFRSRRSTTRCTA